MTLEANVLGRNAARKTDKGLELDVHLAWYRSLPLSCVENIEVSVAGKTIPSEDIRVLYENRNPKLDDLPDLVDDWWFVQDPLTLLLPNLSDLDKGDAADIHVELATRIPYIIIGPENALVQRTKVSREVTLK